MVKVEIAKTRKCFSSKKGKTMATKQDHINRETFKVDPSKVKKDDLMAIIYYVKIKNISSNSDEMVVTDLENSVSLSEFKVHGKELIESCLSADFFAKEEKVTMTKIAEILISSPNRPLTVSFKKKDGSERLLRGRWIAQEALMGRSFVEDLDIPKNDKKGRMREVDHRNIIFLIVDGVKYTLK